MWKKYPSIQQEKDFRKVITHGSEQEFSEQFAITEKIDGANFAIELSENKTICYSRNIELTPEDKFYGYKTIIKEIVEKLESFKKDKFPDQNIIFYGEIYGKGVQNRIYYSDNLKFVCFDIYLPPSDTFVDFEEFIKLEVPYSIKSIYKGTIEECNSFVEKNLPTAKTDYCDDTNKNTDKQNTDKQNIEGYVIRSIKERKDKYDNRIMFKYRNENFMETITAFKKQGQEKQGQDKQDQDSVEELINNYLTNARFLSMISKIPHEEELEYKDISTYSKMIYEDVEKELVSENEITYKKVQKYISPWIKEQINSFNLANTS